MYAAGVAGLQNDKNMALEAINKKCYVLPENKQMVRDTGFDEEAAIKLIKK